MLQECLHLIKSTHLSVSVPIFSLYSLFLKWNKYLFVSEVNPSTHTQIPPLPLFQGFSYILFYSTPSMSFSAPDHSRQHTNISIIIQIIITKTFPCHDSLHYIFLYFSQQISKYFPSFHSFFGYSVNLLLNHSLNQLLSGAPTISLLLEPVYISSVFNVLTVLSATSDPTAQSFFGKLFSFGF